MICIGAMQPKRVNQTWAVNFSPLGMNDKVLFGEPLQPHPLNVQLAPLAMRIILCPDASGLERKGVGVLILGSRPKVSVGVWFQHFDTGSVMGGGVKNNQANIENGKSCGCAWVCGVVDGDVCMFAKFVFVIVDHSL
jgi:hypothetical protein